MSKVPISTGFWHRAGTLPGEVAKRLLAQLAAYAKSRKAGAMLITGSFVLLTMVLGGSAMSNYGWREAQWEELRAATRAAVSAAGSMLARAGTQAGDRQISERVAEFLSGLEPGLTVDADDVTVERDANDVITVSVQGSYAFSDIWRDEGGGQAETVRTQVRVRYEVDRYEVAVAVDLSASMLGELDNDISRLDALKVAFGAVADAVEPTNRDDPGTMMVSLVPFSGFVNVADTCAEQSGACTNVRTAAKERYVRMLAGARDTMAQTLADARAAVADNDRVHWVDTFRHYGMSRDSALTHRHLPSDLLDDTDWNLRRTDVDINVSADVPSMGAWTVDDEDFWYGCVMARWGAYWDADARPTPWNPADTMNWPATADVAGWSPRSASLPESTPLHLSDAPPVATDPNTLFTAFSWPDARIGEGADEKLQGAMIETMFPGEFTSNFARDTPFMGDVHWSRQGNSGRILCPPSPIEPLTDDLQRLRDTANALQVVDNFRQGTREHGLTYVARGVAWSLRTLSPLWQNVWDVDDANNQTRPGRSCAPGEVTGCNAGLRKSILLITDGANFFGPIGNASLLRGEPPSATAVTNPSWRSQALCNSPPASLAEYLDAAVPRNNEAAFNEYFRVPRVNVDLVDASGVLNAAGRRRVAEAMLAMEGNGDDCTSEAARCVSMEASLLAEGATPWTLFRRLDADVVDALLDATNGFNFTGRPTALNHICKPLSLMTSYGRIGDLVEAGDGGAVAGAAPFDFALHSYFGRQRVTSPPSIRSIMQRRVVGWMSEACRIVGLRRVRINAIFIGHRSSGRWAIQNLESCVDAAGGDPDVDEVFVMPTAQQLRDTMVNLFTVRRNLRFLG